MVIKAQNFQPDGAQQLKICLHLKIISLFLNPPSLSLALSLALSLTHTLSPCLNQRKTDCRRFSPTGGPIVVGLTLIKKNK